MAAESTLNQMRSTLSELRKEQTVIGWGERRLIPEKAATVIEAKPSPAQVAVAGDLLDLLATDPKWEVRKAVADALRVVPDEAYGGVLACLSGDDNSFVQRAAQTAIERRRKTPMANSRRRNTPPIGERLAEIERRYGLEAAQMARAIGESYYDQLVGATAHDVRGILTPLAPKIKRLIGHAKDGTLSAGRSQRTLESVLKRLALLEKLVKDMRDYSLPIRRDRRTERLHQILIEAVTLAREDLKERGFDINAVEIIFQVEPHHTVAVAREQFLMAIVNIVKNAIEATVLTEARPQQVKIIADSGEDEIRLTICDTGPGIEVSDLADLRQFLPGRKTKKTDGTGFGLPTAHRIISGHRGTIEIDSEPGQGTIVRVTVPCGAGGADS